MISKQKHTGCATCDHGAEVDTKKLVTLSAAPAKPRRKKEAEAEGDYTPAYRFPFLLGVYLATNAIRDCYTVVDGPDCLFFKIEFVHGKHDINSTLLQVNGRHRVVVSHTTCENITVTKGERVRNSIIAADANPDAGVVMVTSLPMVTIIGTQYDQIIRELEAQTAADVFEVPGRSLNGDWYLGYEDVLKALADNIDVSGLERSANKVAIIGNFHDRNEQDALGNLRELERMFAGIGLDLCATWLSGQSYRELAAAGEADTLIAFPLGREAAKRLARRTGAKVVEVETPFGLGRTQKMIRAVADHLDIRDRADAFIDAELAKIVPRLEWIVPHHFLGRKVAFSGAPELLGGFLQLSLELGMEVVHLSSPTIEPVWIDDLSEEFGALPPLFFDVSEMVLGKELKRVRNEGVDLLIGNSDVLKRWGVGIPNLEFGFPSVYHHAFHDRPHLGFAGYTCFVQRMMDAMLAGRSMPQATRRRDWSPDGDARLASK